MEYIYFAHNHSTKHEMVLTSNDLEIYAPEIKSGIIEIYETYDPNEDIESEFKIIR